MVCKKCGSHRMLAVSAKCDDCFSCGIGDKEHSGYVPNDMNIGDEDYVEFELCLNCGTMAGTFPLPISKLESSEEEEDEYSEGDEEEDY